MRALTARTAKAVAIAVAVAALLVLSGCIMLKSDDIPSWVPEGMRPKTPTATPAAAKQQSRPVKGGLVAYFVKDGRLVPATRAGKASATSPQQALEAVLSGPSTSERAEGLSSAIPEGTRVNDAALDFSGCMRVDLSGEFGSGGSGASMKLRLAQVVYELWQLPGTTGVLIQIEGKPVERFGREGYRLMRPLTTGQFADVAPGR